MRWAFWRKRKPESTAETATAAPLATTAAPAFGAWTSESRDDADEPAPAAPAFSGAAPQHDGTFAPGDLLAAFGEEGGLLDGVDVAPVRADLVALVRAILVGDRPDIDRLRQRLEAYDENAAGLAFVGALAVLGERLLAAVGAPSGAAEPGSAAALTAVDEGDRTTGRADPLLRELVPGASPLLAPFLVRFSVGMPELAAEPEGEVADDDVQSQLVLAILLAQTCVDGHGTPEDVGARLAELLPG